MAKQKIRKIYIQTDYGEHLCIFEPDEKKGYIVTVPGLPGAITWGSDFNEAKKMAKEVIELCIECRVEELFLKKRTHRESPKLRTPII